MDSHIRAAGLVTHCFSSPVGAIHRQAEVKPTRKELRVECALKFAGPRVIIESASGDKQSVDIRTFRLLREAGAFWKVIKRKRDNCITRAKLRAEPNEIGKRITAQPEVVQVGASTWWHTRNIGLLGKKVGA